MALTALDFGNSDHNLSHFETQHAVIAYSGRDYYWFYEEDAATPC